jgi:hypothetical protein
MCNLVFRHLAYFGREYHELIASFVPLPSLIQRQIRIIPVCEISLTRKCPQTRSFGSKLRMCPDQDATEIRGPRGWGKGDICRVFRRNSTWRASAETRRREFQLDLFCLYPVGISRCTITISKLDVDFKNIAIEFPLWLQRNRPGSARVL